MRLKVPVNGIESAKKQIEAGGTDLYLAYSSGVFENYSFSGRGNKACGKQNSEVSYDDFKEIVKIAHDNGVRVELAANTKRMMDDYNGGHELQKKYLEYVSKGIEAGADQIIIGDIGEIETVRRQYPDIGITSSVFLETFNTYQIKLLEKMGVNKIDLDHCMTMEELEEMNQSTNVALELFVHLGCSFIHYTCSLYHTSAQEVNFGIPCLAKYIVNGKEEKDILNTTQRCSLCSLEKLYHMGIASAKIVGRDIPYQYQVYVTKAYAKTISLLDQKVPYSEIRENMEKDKDFNMWRKLYCSKRACKYKFTEYYI